MVELEELDVEGAMAKSSSSEASRTGESERGGSRVLLLRCFRIAGEEMVYTTSSSSSEEADVSMSMNDIDDEDEEAEAVRGLRSARTLAETSAGEKEDEAS